MQVSANADTVSIADIVYLGAQEGGGDGFSAATASAAGPGVRIRIRSFQRPPAISHVVVGPWCTWPILAPTGDPYCTSAFISVQGGETAASTAIGDGAVNSSERTPALSEQQVSVSEQAAVDQSIHNVGAIDAASGSGQCATDSQPVHAEQREENAETIKSAQKCTEPSKKPNTKQGNRRKHKQKQRKQKREAEQKAAVAAAALATAAASVSEGVTCHEKEKTEEQPPNGDVTLKESSQHSEIDEEERKREEIMCEPLSAVTETDKQPDGTDICVSMTDVANDSEQLSANNVVMLTDNGAGLSENCSDSGIVLVMFRQFEDDGSENVHVKNGENISQSAELNAESLGGAAILHTVAQTVAHQNTKNRRSNKRGRRKKRRQPGDNIKEKRIIAAAAAAPVAVCEVADDLSHIPRERLSSYSSLSSNSDSNEDHETSGKSRVKRTYYFTSRGDCDACSDDDVNTISNSEINKEHDDIVTSEEEEEEVEEKRMNEVEEEECCESVVAAGDGTTHAAGEDDQPYGSSSSRCSSDTDDDRADGQHFSTVFVVNSSTDGEESDAEVAAVRLTKIQALPEDFMTAAESYAVYAESTEPLLRSEDGHVDSCLGTLENKLSVSEDSKSVTDVLLVSHRVSLEVEEPVHSEKIVHESECVEPETVPHCDAAVTVTDGGDTKVSDPTVLVNETQPTAFDSERVTTELDVKQREENELRPTFMNKTVLEHVTSDMIASDREEGGGQSALGESDEKSEFLPVNCPAAVQKIDEGSSPAIEVSCDVTVPTDVDVIVPSAHNAGLLASGKDAEGNVVAENCSDLDTVYYNTPERQHVEREFEVSEKDIDHKSSSVPVHSTDSESIIIDKTLKTEDNEETADTVLKRLCSSLDCSTPDAHSTVDTPLFSVEPVPSEDEHTSGLCHSENKEIEEVEESVFVDEPFDGEEDGAMGSDSVLVTDDGDNCESNEGQIISAKPIAAFGDEIVASDNSESSHNNLVSSDVNSLCCEVDEICPHDYIQPDCSTVSMEICPIDPVSTAASGCCSEDIRFVCESKLALLSDQIIPEVSEDISKENYDVNVSETVISADLCGKSVFSAESHDICNENITDVLDTADVVLQSEELKSFSDVSATGIAGSPAEFIQERFKGSCATENKQGENDTRHTTEDSIVSVGNAACNEGESDAEVLRVCAEETAGGVAAAADEKLVPIDNNALSASLDDSPVETAVTHVSVVGEAKEEIRSSGDPVMLTTVHQSAESAGVAGEDQLQGVSCSVVTESAQERDAFDSPAGEPRYTSLVMITQNHLHQESMVSVVTSETTTLVPADVIVRHTNWEEDGGDASPVENNTSGLAGYFTLTLETSRTSPSCKKPLITKTRPQIIKKEETPPVAQQEKEEEDLVKVVTGGDTLSAVVCLEEGLADDDSWVEELDNTGNNHEDEEFATTTPTEDSDSGDEAAVSSASASSSSSSSYSTDREEELRGYHRSAIDFTLHTIVEESCEESEVEQTLEEKKSKKQRPTSASELEKYFFYGLGGGAALGSPPGGCGTRDLDSFSDTCSSIYSEGLESVGAEDVPAGGVCDDPIPAADDQIDPADLASSRLEKYFLTGFMGFSASDRNNRDSDGSGSVGSDSEGKPSPEQRRKKLVRARGTGRQHSSSLDNLVSGELSGAEQQLSELQESEDSSSTETDTHYEDGGLSSLSVSASGFEKSDGQFDTVKRKKKKRSVSSSAGGRTSPASSHSLDEKKDCVSAKSPVADSTPDKIIASSEELSTLGIGHEGSSTTDEDEGCKTPQPEFLLMPISELSASRNKQQSRDSGFIGSCDDLLKEQRTGSDSSSSSNNNDSPSLAPTQKSKQSSISSGTEELNRRSTVIASALDAGVGNSLPVAGEGVSDTNKAPHLVTTTSIPPATALTRKDSFNNWSSDEETNLMMSKMRVFFKTMVAASSSAQGQQKTPQASPSTRQRGTKPPQLVYFENELTRLMKTVPGIRDEQVREIVEYLSSEDTWSDSYDSSDYTSSDLEGAYYMQHQGKVGAGIMEGKSELQEQISASCQQIISKFDTSLKGDDDHEDKAGALNRDTAFVYQRLVASFSKMAGDQQTSNSDPKGSHSPSSDSTPYSSPPLIAKVMHHIGSRLVALMHEVSGGEGLGAATSSPKVRYHHHRRLQAKLSAASTTTDDDSHTDTEQSGVELPGLPRSKSHDLLLEPGTRPTGVSSSMELATSEEREASDYERFSWRGSFESALMAADSRTKLSLLQDSNNASSTTTLAAKRRSAGDLLFAGKSSSREQLLDRVRSCGSIGGSVEDKIWNARRRRSSVPDANTCHAGSGTSADGDDDDDTDDDDDDSDMRSTTLPRSLQTSCSAGTNSLPRLPTSTTASPAPSVLSTASGGGMYKSHSVQHFGQGHVKSARYRPPGFSRPAAPKRALSAPGLQPVHPSRSNRGDGGRRSRLQSNVATPTQQVSGK